MSEYVFLRKVNAAWVQKINQFTLKTTQKNITHEY